MTNRPPSSSPKSRIPRYLTPRYKIQAQQRVQQSRKKCATPQLPPSPPPAQKPSRSHLAYRSPIKPKTKSCQLNCSPTLRDWVAQGPGTRIVSPGWLGWGRRGRRGAGVAFSGGSACFRFSFRSMGLRRVLCLSVWRGITIRVSRYHARAAGDG